MPSSLSMAAALGGVQNVWDNVPAGTTDHVLLPAQGSRKIRVVGVFANAADAGVVTFTFNSKPAGAGTAISPTFKLPVNGGFVLPSQGAWFETKAGEGLTVTTAGASAVGLVVLYSVGG